MNSTIADLSKQLQVSQKMRAARDVTIQEQETLLAETNARLEVAETARTAANFLAGDLERSLLVSNILCDRRLKSIKAKDAELDEKNNTIDTLEDAAKVSAAKIAELEAMVSAFNKLYHS